MKKRIREFEASMAGMIVAVARVFRLLWPGHKKIIISSFAIAILLSTMPFARSGSIALLINKILVPHAARRTIAWLVCLTAGVAFVHECLTSLNRFLTTELWHSTFEFFELKLAKKKSELDVATYEDPAFNDLLSKVEEKSVYPITHLIESQGQNILNLLQVGIAATVFLAFDWKFFLLAIASALPDFFVESKYGKTSWDIYDSDAPTRRKFASVKWHFRSLTRIVELKVFQNAAKFCGLMGDMIKQFDGRQRALESKALRWRLLASIVLGILQLVLYGWIVMLVVNGSMKVGTMTFFLGSLGSFQGALTGFFVNLAHQFEYGLYANDVFKVLDAEPRIKTPSNAVRVSEEHPPLVQFRDVSFAYPGTDRLVLRGVNLEIRPGECLAIVGLNGAGKSTLIKLLLRFYDPTGGQILVNGTDLRFVDLESWYAVISALSQDYATYNFPVRDVIALGRSNGRPHLTRVVRAAKAADAHDFIVNWKGGYDQMIGKEFAEGIDPSHGQSQKIALARSLYRHPRLMILDEPTASIDANAEAKIFEQLESGSDGRSEIIISHRFSTVRRADRICVIEEGAVTELGTHEELMTDPKTYAQLFQLQAKGYQ